LRRLILSRRFSSLLTLTNQTKFFIIGKKWCTVIWNTRWLSLKNCTPFFLLLRLHL
jgi:hypothetical protein